MNDTTADGAPRPRQFSISRTNAMPPFLMPLGVWPRCRSEFRFAAEFFDGELYPGDVLIANDPYHGGGHLPGRSRRLTLNGTTFGGRSKGQPHRPFRVRDIA